VTRRGVRGAAAALLALAAASPVFASGARPYSLSLAVDYGEHPDRATYLDDIRRSLEAWIAATGPLGAPTLPAEADLHLQVVVQRIESKRNYPRAPLGPDVFADTAKPGYPQGSYSTLFETEIVLTDPRVEGPPLLKQPLTVFNEQQPSELVTDPKERAWRVNLDFLNDRIGGLLSKHRKEIERHLRTTGRLP
jgi:hypothetical protein